MRKLYRLFIAAVSIALSVHPLHAQLVAGNGFMKEQYIEAGMRANGVFGSTVACPADYFYNKDTHFGGRLGFISDIGKDGWTVGTPPFVGDYFLPGTPYEAFSVQINGTLYANSGSGGTAMPGSITAFSTTDTSQSIEWNGAINGLKIRQVASVETGKSFILVRVYLTNTNASALSNIFYTREVDPDNEQTLTGSFSTDNFIEQQNPNATSTALISARGLTYGSYLGLGSRDCRARVAIPSAWPNANGANIWNASGMMLTTVGDVTGDNAMSIAFNVGTLAAGDSTSLAYAYVLNAADLPPAMNETDPLFSVKTNAYGSGSNINVCAGLPDRITIANGDGFTWTWSPATGLDRTTGSTVNATLAGPMTYTASGTNTCGTNRSITITLNPTITTAPDSAGTIVGPANVIGGLNASFSVPVINGASSYTWAIPSGATFVSGYNTDSITVNFGASATSGVVSVYGQNGCGVGSPSSHSVTLGGLSAPGLATGVANPSSSPSPGITGTAIPGVTITLYDGATAIGSATTDASGNYSITPGSPLSNGVHALTVKATDGSGNTSSASPALNLTILAPPAQPPAPTLASGTSPTNNNKPPLKGTAQANSTVTIYVDGVAAGTTTADGSGNWTYTPTSAIPDGTPAITVTATDALGSTSVASPALNLIIDTTPPAQPSAPTLVSGTSPVNNNKPALTGTAEANSTVSIYIDGVLIGATMADGSGNWSYTPASPLADGTHAITVTAMDAAGNTSTSSPALNLVVDTTPPAQPLAPSLASGTSPINTNESPLIGTAEANSTVTVYVDGVAIGTTTADGSGNWRYTPASALADGTHAIAVTATDAAGNVSTLSPALNMVVDTTPPVQPSAPGLVSGTSPVNNNKSPLTGTAEANSTVTVYIDGAVAGTSIADASGNWVYTPTSPVADGTHAITVTATDAAGNTSTASPALNLVIDTTPPAQPSAPGLANGTSPTNNNTAQIKGTTEANSTVTIYIDGVTVGTTTADASGNWTYTPTSALAEGTHGISVTATDAAGNTSTSSPALNLVVDTTPPAQPLAPSLASGTSPINNNEPPLIGTAEANSTVTVYVDGVAIGTTIADGSGNWRYTPASALADGTHAITVAATDSAGNVSASSSASHFEIDTQAPTVTIKSTASTVTGAFQVTISFSEPVSGFTSTGIALTDAGVSNFTMVSPTEYTATITPVSANTVTLTVNANTSTDSAGNGNKVSNTLNIQAAFSAYVQQVYPNPARGSFSIEFSGVVPAEGSVMLVDMIGQTVYNQQLNFQGNKLTVNTSGLAEGLYVLLVNAQNYHYKSKVRIIR